MFHKDKLLQRIIIDPDVMVGKPIIKGTRLTVSHILGLLAEGMTYNDIIEEYHRLSEEDITACLVFAQEALDISFVP